MVETLPEMTFSNSRRESAQKDDRGNTAKMFTAKYIPEIARLFHKVGENKGGRLNIEQFCDVMRVIDSSVDENALAALHMMVDTNCKNTISLGELMDFQLKTNQLSESLNFKEKLFPQGIKIIPSNHHRSIIGMAFRPFEGQTNKVQDNEENLRTYRKGQYISVSSDGLLTFWTDAFEKQLSIPLSNQESTGLYSKIKKLHVNDMMYIEELKQVAVCTTERELTFYHCRKDIEQFAISYSLIVETNIVSAINYCSAGTKGVFSYGDMKGFLYVFVSNNIQTNGLFCRQAYEKIALKKYPTVYVSSLLKNPSKDFLCVKVSIFNEECSLIRYFPSLDLFAVCGRSSKAMVLSDFPKTGGRTNPNRVFTVAGNQEVFTCVECSPMVGQLVTGGVDGLLRVWFPHKNVSCEDTLKGHVRPITHILYNHNDSVFLSLSDDMNVRVWSEHSWLCVQSFHAHGLEHGRITSVCYNLYNNELVLANTDIGKCLGRGTDVFKNTITSHDKPLCSALYNSTFRQVVSVCQNGVVSVWDILTGRIVMQFSVTPEQRLGITAMSFDEGKRRLITVSDDGKVRLWNFNNATELAVLPVTVPKDVTGIVCLKNRIFISSRKSDIIYDLDIEKNCHRFLSHSYLKDVISMDASGTLLITASSNGNIVAWNADTGEDLYWCNGSVSPQTQMAGRTDRRHFVAKCSDRHRIPSCKPLTDLTDIKTWVRKSPLIICLKTREENMNTATLLTFAGGYINAWSVNSKGGIIAKFRAVPEKGNIVTAMSTDASESVLLTGDNTGRVCLWNVKEFGFKKQEDAGPFVDIDGWHVSLCPPPLLKAWRAHHSWVVSVICDPACKNIITAGLDCTVQLWTKDGYCIGCFGRDEWEATQACPEVTAVQERVEKSHEAEGNVPESPSLSPSPPPSAVPDFTDLYEMINKVCLPGGDALDPELVKMWKRFSKWIRAIDDAIKLLNSVSRDSKNMITFTRFQEASTNESNLCQSNLKLNAGSTNPPNSSRHVQPAAPVRKQADDLSPNHPKLPPLLNKVPLRQLKPHPLQTLRIKDFTQRTFQKESPCLRTSRSNYGNNFLHVRPPDSSKRNVLAACPPNTQPLPQQTSKSKYPLRGSYKTHRTQAKKEPPNILRSRCHANTAKFKSNVQQPAGFFKPGSENIANHIHLFPISKKVQLTQHPPEPRNRGATTFKQRSLRTVSPSLRRTKCVRHVAALTDSGSTPGLANAPLTHLPPVYAKIRLMNPTPKRPCQPLNRKL